MIDGGTVELTRFGATRLIGVDGPEEDRCGDNAATSFTRRELEGQSVKYELGKERNDRYGRTLAYLTRGDRMHNLALVEEGYARALTIPPNDKYADRFEAAKDEASKRRRDRREPVPASGAGPWPASAPEPVSAHKRGSSRLRLPAGSEQSNGGHRPPRGARRDARRGDKSEWWWRWRHSEELLRSQRAYPDAPRRSDGS